MLPTLKTCRGFGFISKFFFCTSLGLNIQEIGPGPIDAGVVHGRSPCRQLHQFQAPLEVPTTPRKGNWSSLSVTAEVSIFRCHRPTRSYFIRVYMLLLQRPPTTRVFRGARIGNAKLLLRKSHMHITITTRKTVDGQKDPNVTAARRMLTECARRMMIYYSPRGFPIPSLQISACQLRPLISERPLALHMALLKSRHRPDMAIC